MNKPKAILLNGFAGVGKTTIAKMYIDNHPLALAIEGDELIVNIGDWINHEDEARGLIFALTKSMITAAIKQGHDVIFPYLVTRPDQAAEIEQIVHDNNADFYEFYLAADKEIAVQRLLKRGTWGEAGLPPLAKEDESQIEELYARMDAALQKRPNTKHIHVEEGKPLDTYQELTKHLPQ